MLDSSVVLAYLWDEPGTAAAKKAFGNALISSVNLAEILAKLVNKGVEFETALAAFDELDIQVKDFTRDLAESAGEFFRITNIRGLSLGDRACLALAQREKLPAITADRAWKDVDIGVEIELIR